ncbi:MAG: non-canonical purine NTP pyrophosphatase [Gemmatimonadaceae bacterium]|nr:non-canonical purine NTP pyrophosphatase [Gemmatimonadaceae bacterium]
MERSRARSSIICCTSPCAASGSWTRCSSRYSPHRSRCRCERAPDGPVWRRARGSRRAGTRAGYTKCGQTARARAVAVATRLGGRYARVTRGAGDRKRGGTRVVLHLRGERARQARHFALLTGRVVVADDSGLSVAALDGRPGVHSKRWSGSHLEGAALDALNNAFLQERLADAERRGRVSREAAYVCAAACVWPGGAVCVLGETRGQLLHEPRGVGGFGYDPYFFSHDLQATFAEVERDRKAEVSHRGRAFRALFDELEGFFRQPVDRGAQSG